MAINRDPSEVPKFTEELLERAELRGMEIVNIVCMSEQDEDTPLNFLAMVHFLPRKGEFIRLENRRRCEVVDVWHNVAKSSLQSGDAAFSLVPNVYARLLPEVGESVG